MLRIPADDVRAVAIVTAIQSGDAEALQRQLHDSPDLAAARIVDGCGVSRTLLHIVADWPGHFPNGPGERGATTTIWQAAALGLLDRVHRCCVQTPPPAAEQITNAFWHACRGGQREVAEYLLSRGADRNWIGYDRNTPLDVAHASGAGDLVEWLQTSGAKRADELR